MPNNCKRSLSKCDLGWILWKKGRKKLHKFFLAIGGVVISTILSFYLVYELVFNDRPGLNKNLYTWIASGEFQFQIGFLIDRLTVVMMTVVTFVSCMVHVYTIGYMKDDPGYHRFFSYISLFTFSMLILVMSNNFLQLFFWLGGSRFGFIPINWVLV